MFVLLFLLPSSLLAAKAQSFFQALLLLLSCVDDGFISCCPRFTYSGEKERQKKSENKKSRRGKRERLSSFFSTFCLSSFPREVEGGASRVKPPPFYFLGKKSLSLITRREEKNSSLSSCLPSLDLGTRKEKSPRGSALLQNKEREK